jgi:type IX secretion system PorP/SprF family membrane protein
MKKTLLFVFALGSWMAQGQQLPLYANYFFAPQMTNPANSGADGFSELTTMHRQQWQGMEGAPETSALVFNGALNKERIGYSVYAFTDKTDIVSRSGIYGNYAYHAQLSENSVLSFGVGAGYVNNAFDMASVRVKNEGDPFLFPANQNGTLDMTLGINLRVSDFNLGLSVPQLLNPTITYSNNYDGPVAFHLIRHYVARCGLCKAPSGCRIAVRYERIWVRRCDVSLELCRDYQCGRAFDPGPYPGLCA